MKLIDLHPTWYGSGGEGITNTLTGEPSPERNGIGVMFDCPCGNCDEMHRIAVPFHNPLDGGPSVIDGVGFPHGWHRTGDTFETLTLTPSILRKGGCGWHGFVTNGEILTC